MVVLRDENSWGWVEIGELLQRNHSTVVHGCRRMHRMLSVGDVEAAEVMELLRAVKPVAEVRQHYVETAAQARASLILIASFRKAADEYERAARSFLHLAEGVAQPTGDNE